MPASQRPTDAAVIIAELQSEIDRVLSPYIEEVGDYALVDFPDHSNVGDSAIWMGEMLYLRNKLGRAPSYVCSYDNWSKDDLIRAVPTGPILIHGGGNFGDLWPMHQDFRHEILSSFPDRQIIQMPQTIHFSSTSNLKKASDVVNSHEKFVICVRDYQSLEVAKESFKSPAYLCPDMAFFLGPQLRVERVTRELLLLLRTDLERNTHDPNTPLPNFAVVEDWLEEPRGMGTRLFCKALVRTLFSSNGSITSMLDVRLRWFQLLASHRVARGLRQLASSDYVITDRLHTHILCALLDIPHTVLDNNYGKIGGFVEAWTRSLDKMTGPIGELDEAIEAYLVKRGTAADTAHTIPIA
jgi:exopolysaccharide biosynthesis predicted pyruvyltransferase EpsI